MNFQDNYNNILSQMTAVGGPSMGGPRSMYGQDGNLYNILEDSGAYNGGKRGYAISSANAVDGTPQYRYDASGNYTGVDPYVKGDDSILGPVTGWAKDVAPFVLGSLAMYGGVSGLGSLFGGATGASGAGLGLGEMGGAVSSPVSAGSAIGTPLGALPDASSIAYDFGPSLGGAAEGGAAAGLGAAGEAGGAMGTPLGGAVGAGTTAAATGGAGSLSSNPLISKFLSGAAGSVGGSLVNSFLGNGGSDLAKSLGGLGSGVLDYLQQTNSANKQMDFLNNQMNYIKGYGMQGTPERSYLEQTLAAKDAASGRNSQYGPRAAQLEAMLAQPKLQAIGGLTNGATQNVASAANQANGATRGITGALGNIFSQGVSSSLGNIFNNTGSGGQTGMSGYFNAINGNGNNGLDQIYG